MLGGFASVLTLFSLEPLPLMACETINNGNYNKITTQLEKSLDVTIRNISCDERQSIDKMNIDDVLLTPSRKNGSRTICITDTEQYPCKFHIAVIAVGASPSDVLLGTFKAKAQQNKTSVLNETTERLFVRASSIIR
jgi:hypothetical protein